MPTLVYRGTREELLARLGRLAPVLAGKAPDDANVAEGLLLRMGTTLLGKIQDAFVVKSQGGVGEDSVQWQPLSPVTLALRRKNAGAKVVGRLKADFSKLSRARQNLVAVQYNRLLGLYRRDPRSRAALRYARRLLHLTGATMPQSRFQKLYSELYGKATETRARRLALAGAYALILRDTGRMLQSLSPRVASPDRVLRVVPGAVSVGSNVRYMKFHDSNKPRKLKKDGAPKLPRRQILPDAEKPIPPAWWDDIGAAFKGGLATHKFWLRFLGGNAAVA